MCVCVSLFFLSECDLQVTMFDVDDFVGVLNPCYFILKITFNFFNCYIIDILMAIFRLILLSESSEESSDN